MHIQKNFFVGTALATFMTLSSGAMAQDAGRTIWEGFHFGVHGGYTDNDYDVSQTAPSIPFVVTNDSADGAIGGVLYGTSWQFNNWVIGTDSDWSWSDAGSGLNTTGVSVGGAAVPVGTGPFSATADIDYSSSTRLRAGLLVSPNTLIYGTVGIALASVDVSGTLITGGSDDETAVGVVFGGGIETTMGNRWFARLEYLHSDYGEESFRTVTGGSFDVDLDTDVVRGAIGYRFDWSPLDLLN